MKINLKKTLIASTIASASAATFGLSFFIVGGYGNNITSLSEIQNSGYFGLSSSFAKESTIETNTIEKFVNYLMVKLEINASKDVTPLITQRDALALELETLNQATPPFQQKVNEAYKNFSNNRTQANKDFWSSAQKELSNHKNLISNKQSEIDVVNGEIGLKEKAQVDIKRLENYQMWNGLFITGAVFLVIGSLVAISATSYLIILKKKSN